MLGNTSIIHRINSNYDWAVFFLSGNGEESLSAAVGAGILMTQLKVAQALLSYLTLLTYRIELYLLSMFVFWLL